VGAVIIVFHDGMLAAAVGVKCADPLYRHRDLQRLRAERYTAGDTPYPSWYLFGSEQRNIHGLFYQYARQGYQVSLCREGALRTLNLQDTALLDVQFCTLRLPSDGNTSLVPCLTGFLPAEMSSKANLADRLYRQSAFRFLPVQRHYTSCSNPSLPLAASDVWIVKYPFGSAGRCSRGRAYTVWEKAELTDKLPSLLAALPQGSQLIVSEFIHHHDCHAGLADHVVHKMPFLAARTSAGVAVHAYGSVCQKFLYRCRRDLLRLHRELPLADYLGTPSIQPGLVDNISFFKEFTEQMSFHALTRSIFSVDFLVGEDGVPRYLETNKLAATFGERFDGSLPPLIDTYPVLQV